jgi:hypothetical protein
VRRSAPLLITVLILLFCLFVAFVWPTRYRYDRIRLGREDRLIREDRLTGVTAVFSPDSWIRAAPLAPAPSLSVTLPTIFPEFRRRYPEYGDLSDRELAERIAKRYPRYALTDLLEGRTPVPVTVGR